MRASWPSIKVKNKLHTEGAVSVWFILWNLRAQQKVKFGTTYYAQVRCYLWSVRVCFRSDLVWMGTPMNIRAEPYPNTSQILWTTRLYIWDMRDMLSYQWGRTGANLVRLMKGKSIWKHVLKVQKFWHGLDYSMMNIGRNVRCFSQTSTKSITFSKNEKKVYQIQPKFRNNKSFGMNDVNVYGGSAIYTVSYAIVTHWWKIVTYTRLTFMFLNENF